MTIFDIASILFFLAVVGFFLRPLLDGLLPSGNRTGQPLSPRSVSESGGYRAPLSRPRQGAPERESPENYRMPVDDVESRPARPRRATASSPTGERMGADRLRHRLHDHAAVQEAFVLRELLDSPVGMRDQRTP